MYVVYAIPSNFEPSPVILSDRGSKYLHLLRHCGRHRFVSNIGIYIKKCVDKLHRYIIIKLVIFVQM